MLSFKEYFQKNRRLILIPLLVGIALGVIFTILFAIIRNNIILGLAIGLPVLCTGFTLLFFYRIYKGNIDEEIASSINSVSKQLSRLAHDDYSDIMDPAPVNEIRNLERQMVSALDRLRNREYSEGDFDSPDTPKVEFEPGILQFDSFRDNLLARCARKYIANATLLACKIEGKIDTQSRKVLADLLNESFKGSLIGANEEGDIIFCLFESRGNISLVIDRIENMVGSYNVAEYSDNDATVTTCRVGIGLYPFSFAGELIDDAISAISSNDPVHTYDYNESYKRKDKELALTDKYRRIVYTLHQIGSISPKAKSGQDLLEDISKVIKEYAEMLGFENAGYMLKIPGRDSFKTTYEYKAYPEASSFSNYREIAFERLSEYISLFDSSGVFFGSDVDGLPLSCRGIFENLHIKSFYHFIIYCDGQMKGIVYFNTFEREKVFTSPELEVMMNLHNCLCSLLNTLISWYKSEQANLVLDSVLKLGDKYIYAINNDTYELTYVSSNLSKCYPDMKVGTKCYEYFSEDKESPCKDCPLTNGSCTIKRERIGTDLQASIVLSTTGALVEKYVLIENQVKDTRRVEEQLDLQFRIPNAKALREDIAKELKGDVSGYVAMISVFDLEQRAAVIEKDGKYKVLGEIINRLSALGYRDWLYRYSDDTIAILFHRYPRAEALSTIEKIYDRISGEVVVDGIAMRLDYCASLISYPGDMLHTKDIKESMDKANKQMRELGHNILYIFGEKDGRKLDRSSYILDVLDEAVKKNKLQIFIQPVFRATNHQPVEGEALLRLMDPTRGYIPPLEFVPIASKNGRMFEIEQSIIVSIGELWKKHGFGIFKQVGVERISVNISQDSISTPSFAERVERTYRKYKFPKGFLQLEIAEPLAYKKSKQVKDIMDKLKPLGVAFAIDNFGTVATTIGEETTLPFDVVKIDRSCLIDIEQNQRSIISLSYMIDKAKELGCEVVAQGIETDRQVELTKGMNIDDYQGYLYSKPLSVNNYIEFLNFKN